MSVAQAGAVAMRRDGALSVLLVRTSDGREWIFPKGHIEPGETASEAAVRELREEAGVVGDVIAPLGSISYLSKEEHVSVEYYLVAARDSTPLHEARESKWCTLESAAELLSFSDAKTLLENVRKLVKG